MSTPYPFSFPVVLDASGAVPTAPTVFRQQLMAAIAAAVPGYTGNLPGSLISDILGTDIAALSLIDQARVELIDSLTPNGANEFLLQQLGQIYGIVIGSVTNTSVLVVFSGTVGYVIPQGFIVTDGTYFYQVQAGGPILSTGSSAPLNAIATTTGTFGVNANSVTQISSSYPNTYNLTVNNPSAGTPGTGAETLQSYRSRIMQAGLAASVGTARYIKTLVNEVTGVSSNSVAVQKSSPGIRVMASGGDPYAIAYAILCAVADPSMLVGSAVNSARNVTVSLIDSPDIYSVTYVNTPTQIVTLVITWNTTLANFSGGSAFAGLVQQPLANYVNALQPGQVINVLEMNNLFQDAVSSVLNPAYLTRLVFSVSLNGVVTPEGTGTYAVTGDPESNFSLAINAITVQQG